jgi:alpha-glucosidase
VDAVWLSPFYPSALADGGYDVDDYRDVDPRIGTLEQFDEFVAGAHAAGIRVIVDIVPNHSSDRHEWFRAALAAAPGSPERERYVFRDGLGENGELPPSDWVSHFGGSAWTRVPDGQWYLHLFAPEQPDWNWGNPEVREDFHTTLRFWSDRGVDGFRVDVAHALAKDLAHPLRSQPTIDPMGIEVDGTNPLFDRDDVHEIYRGWRAVFNEYDPPRTAVAEAWVPVTRRVLYATPEELGQAFNFDLVKVHWDAEQFRTVIVDNLTLAESEGASSTWTFSNHDIVRHPTRFGLPADTDLDAWLLADGADPVEDVALGERRARAAILLLLALPGSAYVYQGEELGLREVADLQPDELEDPIWLRSGHTVKGRDGCRVPLPWTAEGSSFGFGDDGAHLPQPAWFAGYAADRQDDDPSSMLGLYRSALVLRRQLDSGPGLAWQASADTVLHFERAGGWHVVVNLGEEPAPVPDGKVLIASAPLVDGLLPGDAAAWIRG